MGAFQNIFDSKSSRGPTRSFETHDRGIVPNPSYLLPPKTRKNTYKGVQERYLPVRPLPEGTYTPLEELPLDEVFSKLFGEYGADPKAFEERMQRTQRNSILRDRNFDPFESEEETSRKTFERVLRDYLWEWQGTPTAPYEDL
jgi:hypothetical protein